MNFSLNSSLLSLVFALSSSLPGAFAWATPLPEQPDANELYVESIDFQGRLCPAGSISYNFDQEALSISYADFLMALSSTDQVIERHCKVQLSLHLPAGYSLRISRVTMTGHINLSTNAESSAQIRLHHAGKSTDLAQHQLQGPLLGAYRYQTAPAQTMWTPCRAGQDGQTISLSLSTQLSLHGGAATLSGLSSDRALRQVYQLAFRPCAKS